MSSNKALCFITRNNINALTFNPNYKKAQKKSTPLKPGTRCPNLVYPGTGINRVGTQAVKITTRLKSSTRKAGYPVMNTPSGSPQAFLVTIHFDFLSSRPTNLNCSYIYTLMSSISSSIFLALFSKTISSKFFSSSPNHQYSILTHTQTILNDPLSS